MLKFLAGAAAVTYAAKKGYAKDLGKGLGIAGALFFASGLGVAGFNAFRGASSITDFFGAVGQTTMAGAQGLLGAVGIGSGVSQGLASSLGINQGATLFGGGSSSMAGLDFGGMGMAQSGANQMSAALSGDTQSNVLNKFFGGASISDNIRTAQNRQLLMSGLQAGAQMYLANRQYKKEKEQRARLNFFGDRARGGSPELPFEVPSVMSRNTTPSNPDTVGPPPVPGPFEGNRDTGEDEEDYMPPFLRGSG